jgi:hypothetical protein
VAADAADSPIRAIALANERRLTGSTPILRAAAQRSARWMDKPSYDWSLQAPGGETLRSADMRDRPLVECYWSAESPWGLRALEMMRRFNGRVGAGAEGGGSGAGDGGESRDGGPADKGRVRVVCINMDRDVALARRAIAACGGGLTHVLGESLSANEPEMDYPTVRLVDREGRVRHVIVGWRPDLYETLAPVIESLASP